MSSPSAPCAARPQVLELGRFIPTDADGCLIRDAHEANVPPRWRPLIDEVRDLYTRALGADLHSVYLRGSVPRGLSIDGISDLDSFAVAQRKRPDLAELFEVSSSKLAAKYPFCTEVELFVVDLANVLRGRHLALTIATQAICIAGEDLLPKLPKFRPNRRLLELGHVMMLDRELDQAEVWLLDGSEDVREVCRWLSKRIIRSGLELFVEVEGQYTRDLWPCYDVFSRHVPEKREAMFQALELALSPSDQPLVVRDALIPLGRWLAEQRKEGSGRVGPS